MGMSSLLDVGISLIAPNLDCNFTIKRPAWTYRWLKHYKN
jgi:hypothetical protein